jgi:hypothetical protein
MVRTEAAVVAEKNTVLGWQNATHAECLLNTEDTEFEGEPLGSRHDWRQD